MALEIERKFLVTGTGWRTTDAVRYRQSYLCRDPERTVRIRTGGGRAFLVVKGPAVGIVRHEFEYPIPMPDAEQLLQMCVTEPVDKVRHRVPVGQHVWEVDEFFGVNAGLIVAEVELSDAAEEFERPPWLGPEVTEDRRFANSQLAVTPWTEWPDAARIRSLLETSSA